MSVYFEISALEKDIASSNFRIQDRIANIRYLLQDEDKKQLHPDEIKAIALHIWNNSIKLQRLSLNTSPSNSSVLELSIIPSMRILVSDVYQKYINLNDYNDRVKMFCILSHTYKSLLDSNNIEYANQYLKFALDHYLKLDHSPNVVAMLVQLIIWQANYEISTNNNYDKALAMLKEFTTRYKIESTFLISFIFEKSMENHSIDWIKFCLSLTVASSTIPIEWKFKIEFLLAQFYINNDEPEESLKIISTLPDSLNKAYLELKCTILFSSNTENLFDKLVSFIPQAIKDQNILINFCIFIADKCDKIGQVAISFITKVLISIQKISNFGNKKLILTSAARIYCELDDIEAASFLLNYIKSISINDICQNDLNEISEILWNKALEMFDTYEYEMSAQWMQLSRSLICDNDNEGQSSCFRFICRCFIKANEYEKALSNANNAIQWYPSCPHAYLLKFRIFIKMEYQDEAYKFIDNIINNSPHISEFEPSFFTSIAAELHSLGNNILALKTLLKSYELNFNSNGINQSAIQATIQRKIKKNTINSIFALLQEIDDVSCISKAINILSSRWSTQVIYRINNNEIEQNNEDDSDSLLLSFTSYDIISYVSIAYQNGLDLKKKGKWKKAINSFIGGSLFSGELIECKAPCVFEAVDCCIKIVTSNKDSNSTILVAQKAVDEIAPTIEYSLNIDQNYKEGLLLAKLKISLIEISIKSNKETFDLTQVIELIELIESPNLLFDAIIFICEYKIPLELIFVILEASKRIDQLSNTDILSSSLAASLLYQLVLHSKTLEESKKSYEIILDFLDKDNNLALFNSSQLQFFMSHAWNTGVRCAKSLRSKDAEWWFKMALNIISLNEDLKLQYNDELNEKYLQFLVHNKNRIAFSF